MFHLYQRIGNKDAVQARIVYVVDLGILSKYHLRGLKASEYAQQDQGDAPSERH